MITIFSNIKLPESEFEFSAIRAQGAGGQNVNKVSSAIHLRFDIKASSLPSHYRHRLLKLKDSRLSKDGVLVIKAQEYRTQEKNKQAALERLRELIRSVAVLPKKRVASKPSRSSVRKRLERKVKHGRLKSTRKRPTKSDLD